MKIKVNTIVVGDMEENCYILSNEETKEALIFDPGAESDKIIKFIDDNGYNPRCILLTHGHFDHIGACDKLRENYNIPIFAGENEELLLREPKVNLSSLFGSEISLTADNFLNDKDHISISCFDAMVISTPGHTPGGVCYYFKNEGILFTGDTLFCGSIGRTDFPYGDTNALLESIKKLNDLPDETLVYSGHGYDTLIGTEKETNPYMSSREIL